MATPERVIGVTPYVGVWIETLAKAQQDPTLKSLLMWECGLKLCTRQICTPLVSVTPYVGVWIETRLHG